MRDLNWDLWRSSCLTPLLKRVQLKHIAQGHVQAAFEHHEGWRFHYNLWTACSSVLPPSEQIRDFSYIQYQSFLAATPKILTWKGNWRYLRYSARMSSILTICEKIRTLLPRSRRRISSLSRRISLPLLRIKCYKTQELHVTK